MSTKNEEVLTATSTEGETSFMICKTSDENQNQKLCTDIENPAATSSNQSAKEKGMLDNNTYNLIEQLVNENKSLWRIKNYYKNDASMDNETKEFWNFVEKDKEEITKLLTEKLKERL